MPNEIILIIEIVITFALMLLNIRLLGKFGAITWVSTSTVIANIISTRTIGIFGLDTISGAALFASSYIIVNIIREYYGVNYARNAIAVSFGANILFIVTKYLTIWYALPIFSISIKRDILTLLILLIAHILNIFIYNKIEVKTKGKRIWLRSIISPTICNLLATLAFVFVSFSGTYAITNIFITFAITFVIQEVMIACGIPALYISRNIIRRAMFKKRKFLF